MAAMKLRLVAALGFLVALTPLCTGDPTLKALGRGLDPSVLLRSVEEAKRLVDSSYQHTQARLEEKIRTNTLGPADVHMFFKKAVGGTRAVIKAANYMDLTLVLLKEKLRPTAQRDFNITDVLSLAQMRMIYKATGCSQHDRQTLRCDFQSTFRTITGECNNRRFPVLGSSNRPYALWLPQEYEDGVSLPRGWTANKQYNGFALPNARAVSNAIVRFPNERLTDDQHRSVIFMQWGQFIDHDLDFGPMETATLTFREGIDCEQSCVQGPPCFPIRIPPNDPVKRPGDCLPFIRASPACNGGYAIRNQINALTSFLDASMVYGSEVAWAQQLRNLTNNLGLLAINLNVTDRGLAYPPFGNPPGFPDFCPLTNPALNISCFFGGDNRVSEMPALTVLHTLFLREHNRLATELKRLNPGKSGERIYQDARKILGAMIQKLTYSEWLPAVLGNAIPRGGSRDWNRYRGYNNSVDPSVASVFTIAFRFGHTLIRPVVFRLDSRYRVQSQTPLNREFSASWRIIREGGIDPLLRGMLAKPAKQVRQDQLVVDALRDRLFEQFSRIGLDLTALNMQRGRDLGLPGYNAWRQFCGLSQPRNEAELARVLRNPGLARKFIQQYGTPANIDLWVGGVAEPIVRNGRVGELLACLIRTQFEKVRTGDRFWWENPGVFTQAQRQALTQVSLPRIICDNTHLREVPRFVFRANRYPRDFVSCNAIPRLSLFPWTGRSDVGARNIDTQRRTVSGRPYGTFAISKPSQVGVSGVMQLTLES